MKDNNSLIIPLLIFVMFLGLIFGWVVGEIRTDIAELKDEIRFVQLQADTTRDNTMLIIKNSRVDFDKIKDLIHHETNVLIDCLNKQDLNIKPVIDWVNTYYEALDEYNLNE